MTRHDTNHDMYKRDRRAAWRATLKTPATRDQIARVILEVCGRFEITRNILLSGSQLRQVSQARGTICRELYGVAGCKEIARALKVHHATVLYHWQLKEKAAAPAPVQFPDLSGEWAI